MGQNILKNECSALYSTVEAHIEQKTQWLIQFLRAKMLTFSHYVEFSKKYVLQFAYGILIKCFCIVDQTWRIFIDGKKLKKKKMPVWD